MQSVQSGSTQQKQSKIERSAGAKNQGLIRRWLGKAVRNWQRRKMIAALHALDCRTLSDIGIERGNIEDVVDGFDTRELQMVPLTATPQAIFFDHSQRRAA